MLGAAGAFWLLSSPKAPLLDEGLLAFVHNCEAMLQSDCECNPHFPEDQDAVQQVVDHAEDRSWQGHYTSKFESEKDFLCSGTPTSDEVHLEVFREDL